MAASGVTAIGSQATLVVRCEIAKVKGYDDVKLPLHPQLRGELADFVKDAPRSVPLFDHIPRQRP